MTNDFSPSTIKLTPVKGQTAEAIYVQLSQLIAYYEQPGFTRLRVIGGKEIDVRETAAEIERLVRQASTNSGWGSAKAAA